MSDGKRAAGEAAAERVESGMRLGLGTGSTVAFFLDALGQRDLDVAGVPTSEATREHCDRLGIALLDPADVDMLDLVVDGADELDHQLTLTKGGGGALLREKVVASMSARMVVIATPDKVVDRLADSFALPVEVVPFAAGPVRRRLEAMGFTIAERRENGNLYSTDNGNRILDARMPGGLEDPAAMEAALCLVPGIVEVGLFVEMADEALLGHPDGRVEVMTASDA